MTKTILNEEGAVKLLEETLNTSILRFFPGDGTATFRTWNDEPCFILDGDPDWMDCCTRLVELIDNVMPTEDLSTIDLGSWLCFCFDILHYPLDRRNRSEFDRTFMMIHDTLTHIIDTCTNPKAADKEELRFLDIPYPLYIKACETLRKKVSFRRASYGFWDTKIIRDTMMNELKDPGIVPYASSQIEDAISESCKLLEDDGVIAPTLRDNILFAKDWREMQWEPRMHPRKYIDRMTALWVALFDTLLNPIIKVALANFMP